MLGRRGERGCHIPITEYAKKHYRKRYRASLAPSDKNFRLAAKVYLYGIRNNVGPTVASYQISIIERGPIYTRLANFVRETGLWDVEKRRWAVIPCQVTATFVYHSARKGPERARVTATIPAPLGALIDMEFLGAMFLEDAMIALNFPIELIEEIRTGIEIADASIGEEEYTIEKDRIRFNVDLEFEVKRKRHQYTVEFEERKRKWLEWFEYSEE